MMVAEYDFAIIGSGPAGLSAATTASQMGLKTVLFDDQSTPGGQIYRGLEKVAESSEELWRILGKSYQHGERLISDFRASAAQYEPLSNVWTIGNDGVLGIASSSGGRTVRAKRVLISGGAMERPFPIPGWTLPGVMTAGSAQILMKANEQIPDVPCVIVGSGPLLFLVAWQLVKCGAPVKAVLETTPRSNYLKAAQYLPGALNEFASIWQGLKWIKDIKKSGVKIISNVRDVRLNGTDKLERVEFKTASGKSQTIECDLALLHQGVVPNYQLASLAGCELTFDETQQCWATQKDIWGATSEDMISVAGDCGGIGGAIVAEHEGRLAGFDAALRVGLVSERQRNENAASDLKSVKRLSSIRRFLDTLYKPADWVSKPVQDETIICRCEEVTVKDIRNVVQQGCLGPNQAKTMTRAGMGPCQGRLCGLTVSSVIASERGVPIDEVGLYRVRPPIKPVLIEQLVNFESEHQPDS